MTDGIRREICSLALPVVFSSLLQRIALIVDLFLIGGLGAAAIAAVGVGQLLMLTVMTVVWGLAAGTGVIVAQLWGARRQADAGHVAFQAVLVGAVIGLVISAAGVLFSRQGAIFLGVPDDVLALATPYLRTVFVFFTCSLLVNLISAVMHGAGNTRSPLYAAVGMNVIHFAVAYPLIHGLWGLPALGVTGVAVATAVSECSGAAYLLHIGFKQRHILPGRISRSMLAPVLRIGLPVLGDRLLQQTGQLLFVKAVMLYGTVAYAAHQIGMAIEAISFLPGLGISLAATTAVGQRLGAQQIRQAVRANQEAMRLAVVVMAGIGLIFFVAPTPLLRLFSDDPEVIGLGTTFLMIAAILQIPMAIALTLAGSLRGAGDTPFLFLSTVVGNWAVRVPLAWLCAAVWHTELAVVWSLMAVDWFVRMGMLVYRVRTDDWHRRVLVHDHGTPPEVSLAPLRVA
ncbi:MAG: MATE family efflux transporter [Nitrospirota bacterium]